MSTAERTTNYNSQIQRQADKYIVKGIRVLHVKRREVLTAADSIGKDDGSNALKNEDTEVRILTKHGFLM